MKEEARRRGDAETLRRGDTAMRLPRFSLRVSLSPPLSVALFCALALIMGCTLQASRKGIPPEVQAAIDAVSSDITDGRYEKVYNESAEEWRQATTLEQSNATFNVLKTKLGEVKSRSFHSASEQQHSSGALPGHSFVITYKTTFDRGEGMETFTLIERDGRWRLARYFVNSDALK